MSLCAFQKDDDRRHVGEDRTVRILRTRWGKSTHRATGAEQEDWARARARAGPPAHPAPQALTSLLPGTPHPLQAAHSKGSAIAKRQSCRKQTSLTNPLLSQFHFPSQENVPISTCELRELIKQSSH